MTKDPRFFYVRFLGRLFKVLFGIVGVREIAWLLKRFLASMICLGSGWSWTLRGESRFHSI